MCCRHFIESQNQNILNWKAHPRSPPYLSVGTNSSTTQSQTLCVRAVPKHSLSSGRLGCAHRPLGTAFPQPPPLLWKQLVQCYMNSKLFLFPLNTPTIAHHNQECFLFFLYKIKKSNLSSNSINEIIWVKPKASVASQKETQCQQHRSMHICISKSI